MAAKGGGGGVQEWSTIDGTPAFSINEFGIGQGTLSHNPVAGFQSYLTECFIRGGRDRTILNVAAFSTQTQPILRITTFGGIDFVRVNADGSFETLQLSHFGDDIDLATDKKILYRDAAIGMYSQADSFLDIFADGGVRIGNSSAGAPTSFSKFELDGTLEFNGDATVFKDINIGASTLSGPIGLQPDTVNYVDENGADTGIATLGIAVGEGFSGQFEFQHDYKEGSDIVFHVHWQGIAAPTGTDKVQWQLTYTVGAEGATLDAPTVITFESDFDTQYAFKRSDSASITGTNFNIEDQFVFTLERIAASADEYGGDALAATVGIHYELDTVGSRQVLTK